MRVVGCGAAQGGYVVVQLKEWKDMFSTKSDDETRVPRREAKELCADGAVQSHDAVSNVLCVR